MSVLYPLIQALVLFAVAPLLSGITRVARARLHNRRLRRASTICTRRSSNCWAARALARMPPAGCSA